MKLKQRTKDRLLTAGAVLLICAVGVVLPGCASTNAQAHTLRTSDGVPISITQVKAASICTTDFDCEMHERQGTRHSEWTWKKVAAVVTGMLVTGYLMEREFNRGSGSSHTSTIDVRTPGVNCIATGCAQ